MNPIVSIIIPTYNREKELKRALKSVISQTRTDWEVIVVDNNSSDNTKEIVNGFNDERIRFYSIENNGIIAKSRNLGIKNSNGVYIAFLDSDDWWKSNKLEISLRYLEMQNVDVIYHDLVVVRNINILGYKKRDKARQVYAPVSFDLLTKGNALKNSSVVLRKSLLEKIGGISENPQIIGMEDFDTWVRISKLTEHFFKIPGALGYYGIGKNNTSVSLKKTRIDYFEEKCLKNINKIPFWVEYQKARFYYKINDYDNAIFHLNRISHNDVKLQIKLKIIWMILNGKIHGIKKI